MLNKNLKNLKLLANFVGKSDKFIACLMKKQSVKILKLGLR